MAIKKQLNKIKGFLDRNKTLNIKIKKELVFKRFSPVQGEPHYLFMDSVPHNLFLLVEDDPLLMDGLEEGHIIYVEATITRPVRKQGNTGHILEDVTYIINKSIAVADDEIIGSSHD